MKKSMTVKEIRLWEYYLASTFMYRVRNIIDSY